MSVVREHPVIAARFVCTDTTILSKLAELRARVRPRRVRDVDKLGGGLKQQQIIVSLL
jgi:hypothetical protein